MHDIICDLDRIIIMFACRSCDTFMSDSNRLKDIIVLEIID